MKYYKSRQLRLQNVGLQKVGVMEYFDWISAMVD